MSAKGIWSFCRTSNGLGTVFVYGANLKSIYLPVFQLEQGERKTTKSLRLNLQSLLLDYHWGDAHTECWQFDKMEEKNIFAQFVSLLQHNSRDSNLKNKGNDSFLSLPSIIMGTISEAFFLAKPFLA